MSFRRKSTVVGPLLAAITFAACFSQISCRERVGFGNGINEARQELAAAETSAEWIQRLKLDLANQSYSQRFLTQLYAELPPMDQWPAVCRSIEKIANDRPALEKMMSGTFYSMTAEDVAGRLLLFSALLKDDTTDHEMAVRNLVNGTEPQDYRKEETIRMLLMVSRDREATLDWIKENQKTLLVSGERSSHRRDEEKPDWQVALAENRVDKGTTLLEEAIAKASDSDKPELLQKLLKLGIVLENEPLTRKATTGMQDLLLEIVSSDDSISGYTYQGVFEFQASRGEWQEIANFFGKFSKLYQKRREPSQSYDFGQMDHAYATYLTALYRLGKTAELRNRIEKAYKNSTDNSRDFFSMMEHATPGQPPLGVLYMDALKAANQPEEALTYSLNLLARNRGTDAFYEYLIGLDPARAKEFITALHSFDPYEERPLIWLAEIARHDGDLDLAQKTIDQAIALDPSDGDHGKDTRMFCYEVLARVHEDSGRAEKAVFFRSVVDSIRQGEAADDFLYTGLIKEATERYTKALGQFADAYCLQSRLAMTLARNGQFDESVEHFKKAFSLMPVSFGPRESHCFGCEGLFDDKRVIEIALPLLEAFEKDNPDNPRTPYLLGLILAEKNDFPQAMLAYRRALKLDPNYFNAAKKLLALLEKSPKDFTAAEELRAEMFKIAPYPEKPEYIAKSNELRAFWELAENFPPSPLDLPPLSPVVAPEKKEQYIEVDESFYSFGNYGDKNDALDGWSPSELRRGNEFLSIVDQIR